MDAQKKAPTLNYLREQRGYPTGNYREYLVNTYNFIFKDSKTDNRG